MEASINATRRLRLAFVLACASLAGACAGSHGGPCWVSSSCRPPVISSPHDALPLALDEWAKESLQCQHGDCQDWYSIEIERRKRIQVTVYSPNESGLSGFDLVLLDAGSNELARASASQRGPKQIKMRLSPGRYSLGLLATQTHGDAIPYEVIAKETGQGRASEERGKATSQHGPSDPGPAKRAGQSGYGARTIQSAVLEVSADQRSVYLVVGEEAGVHEGQRGELVLEGREGSIRIEVTEVFEAGSRARILDSIGGPNRSIDPLAARALIQAPARN